MQRKVVMLKLCAAILGVTATFMLSSPSVAATNYYICNIEGWHSTQPDVFRQLYARYMIEPIGVDRDTGEVTHVVFGNTSFNNVYLLNRGSQEWSFKVFADSGRTLMGEENYGGHTHYLEVHEFAAGDKPFIGVADGTTFWGSCT